jgi:cytochrome P450
MLFVDLKSRTNIFLSAVSNEYNGTFWLMAQLLYDRPLLEQVKQETEAAWQSGKLDIKYLSEHCPVLDAVFNEFLRHKNAAGAMRLVAEQTTIGSKKLEPGNMAYVPFYQIHTNENVWGDRCLEFDHTRFLKRKSLARNTSFRPFGGGGTYCPGRTLAKQEVFSAVAIILHRFDVRLAVTGEMKQPFPILNIKTPSLGLNGPVKGMDIIVEMTEGQTYGLDLEANIDVGRLLF